MRFIGSASGGSKPTAPTIGAATDDGTGTGVSVAFTPSTYIGKGTITYTATSSPGSLTASGAGSPLVVSGLTTGTAYTFTVNGTTNYGVASDSSAASNSVTPAAPSSYESIATATGNGSATSLTISSIPSTYKSLQIRIAAKDGTGGLIRLQCNSDTGTNYSKHRMTGNGSTVTATGGANATSIDNIAIAGNTSVGVAIIDILDYASTAKYKTIRSLWGIDSNGVDTQIIGVASGCWLSTSAITSLTFTNALGVAFTSTTTIALYGIKG